MAKQPEKPKQSDPKQNPLPDSLQAPKPDKNSFQKGLTQEELKRLQSGQKDR